MRYAETSNDYSSISRVAALLCEPWTLLIVREAFRGSTRFEQFQTTLDTPRSLLSDRLRKLVDHGVFKPEPYLDNAGRRRNEYQLTPAGRQLFAILMSVRAWGDVYASPDGPPERWQHRDCGGEIGVEVVCAHGHRVLDDHDVVVVPGPGAPPATDGHSTVAPSLDDRYAVTPAVGRIDGASDPSRATTRGLTGIQGPLAA